MKKLLVIILSALSLTAFAQTEVKRVAILETVDREDNVGYGIELMLRAALSDAVTHTPGYEGYDRVDLQSITGEQSFQRTGMVNDADIKKIGVMTGAQFVLVAEAAQLNPSHIVITAKILDVETARLTNSAYETMGTTSDELKEGCNKLAATLFGNTSQTILPVKPTESEERRQKELRVNDSIRVWSERGWSLAGRSVISLPKPSNDFKAEGRVVVAIIVDAGGKVVSAKATEGTTVTDDSTIQLAIRAAYKAVFSKTDSPNKQFGTITYIFKFN